MTGRVLTAFAVAFAGFGPVSPARAAVPVVRGTTVVVAKTTARTTVYVPTRTQVTATVEGPGRLVGAILRERHAQPEEAGMMRTLGGMYQWGKADVRKGFYTLSVLTDGAPVRVTLRFAKLTGSTSLAATGSVAWGRAPYVTSVGAPVSWSAGAGIRTSGPADLFTVAAWKQDESVYAGSHGCSYDGSDGVEELGQYRWLPGCPLGMSVGFSEVRNPAYPPGPMVRGGAHAIVGRTSVEAAGEYGYGVWVQAQNVRETSGYAVWIGR